MAECPALAQEDPITEVDVLDAEAYVSFLRTFYTRVRSYQYRGSLMLKLALIYTMWVRTA